jgi:hypothetical protein
MPVGVATALLLIVAMESKVSHKETTTMPVRKVSGGYKYGTKGKVYSTKTAAAKQGRAVQATKARQNQGKRRR